MKRTLVYVILTILAAGLLGTLINKDPGYALLSYNGATLESSLWTLLATVVITVILVSLLLRLLRAILSTSGLWSSWRSGKRLSKANQNTERGLVSLAEGHWERAKNYLQRSAGESSVPLANYLGAAQAAHNSGDSKTRDNFLDTALEQVEGSALAVGITRAQFSIDAGDWQQGLAVLERLQRTGYVVELLAKVYKALDDWDACRELLLN